MPLCSVDGTGSPIPRGDDSWSLGGIDARVLWTGLALPSQEAELSLGYCNFTYVGLFGHCAVVFHVLLTVCVVVFFFQ